MDKRTEYIEKLSAQMVEWDMEIDQLRYKADGAMSREKSDYSRAIDALQIKRDEAAIKLQGISAASGDEWEDLKTGTEHIGDELRTMVRDSITKIA
jgi:hypothetical protein